MSGAGGFFGARLGQALARRLPAVCAASVVVAACAPRPARSSDSIPPAAGPTCAHAPLPTEKLSCKLGHGSGGTPVVLVACGSFNPPTVMHMRMFDLAAHELAKLGYDVWGGYLSPVGDAYGKPGLAPASHRVDMCREAAAPHPLAMVDAWEAQQPEYVRTLVVLRHVQRRLDAWLAHAWGAPRSAEAPAAAAAGAAPAAASPEKLTIGGTGARATASKRQAVKGQPADAQNRGRPGGGVRVMLLCGADVLASMAAPGAWVAPEAVLAEHGVVVVARDGTDVDALLRDASTVVGRHRQHVVVVREPVANGLSSSVVRAEVAAGRPVRYLVPDGVLGYLQRHGLYGGGDQGAKRPA